MSDGYCVADVKRGLGVSVGTIQFDLKDLRPRVRQADPEVKAVVRAMSAAAEIIELCLGIGFDERSIGSWPGGQDAVMKQLEQRLSYLRAVSERMGTRGPVPI